MANKPIPQHRKAKSAGISLPPQLIKDARKFAFSQNLSLSGLVRVLLTQKLEGAK